MRELLDYLKSHKKLWLLPILAFLVLLGLLALFSQSSPLAPFIYALF